MHRYKRSSRGSGTGPSPEDGGNFVDGSEGEDDDANASDDASEDEEESTNEGHSESNSGGESEGDVHDDGNGDAQDQDRQNTGDSQEVNNDAAEGTDHHRETVDDYRNPLFDITLSYNYALHLTAEAGIRPTKIVPFHRCSETACVRSRIGLTDCAGLARSKETLERLTTLDLSFVLDQPVPQGDPFEEM